MINELNAIQNSRTSVEKKCIYLGIQPSFPGARRETARRLLKSCKAPSENQLKSTLFPIFYKFG